MGSAHFLTAALDRIADRFEIFLAETDGLPGIRQLLRELTQEMGPVGQQPEDGDLLRRLILKRCIYGVDLSPMAVEVANITLWLASFVPGLALSYLGSNLKCGNALIGVADLAAVESEQLFNAGPEVKEAMERAATLQRKQAAIADRTPEEVKRSEGLGIQREQVTHNLRKALDLWTAEPMGVGEARLRLGEYATPILSGNGNKLGAAAPLLERAKGIAQRHRFFHWPLEFPGIFHRERPGFDVVVGNPPWNEITVEESGFYALRAPGLRGLPIAEQRRRIAELDEQHPTWRGEFEQEREDLAVLRGFFNKSGGYVMQGVGDTDLYQLFCERYSHLMRQDGFMGVVLPRTAFLAEGAKGFRQWLFRTNLLRRIDLLLNKRYWAFAMEQRYTIALLSSQRRKPDKSSSFQLTGPSASQEEFQEAIQGGVNVRTDSLGESLMIPLLPSQAHAELLAKMRRGIEFDALTYVQIVQNCPKLKNRESAAAASHAVPHRELDETQQRRLFNHPPGEGRIPVWKGGSFDQYNPHNKKLAGYADFTEIEEFVQKKRRRSRVFKRLSSKEELSNPQTHPIHHYRIAFRDVTNRTNSRTVIACLIPPRIPLTNTAPYLIAAGDLLSQASVLGLLNSLPFDWIARRYVETHLSFFILNLLTLPILPPPNHPTLQRIGKLAARLSCIDERYAQFAADIRAEDIDVECGPLTDLERTDKRAEIDARVARAYGLTADELGFIFTDFTENAVNSAHRELTLAKFEELP